jgi:hypothetical protein
MSSKEQNLALQRSKAPGYCKENLHKEHLLNITEITYASPQNVTLYQQQILANPSLEK